MNLPQITHTIIVTAGFRQHMREKNRVNAEFNHSVINKMCQKVLNLKKTPPFIHRFYIKLILKNPKTNLIPKTN